MRVFHERLSICVYVSFPFGIEGGIWDLIVLVPDHCLSFTLHGYSTGPSQRTESVFVTLVYF